MTLEQSNLRFDTGDLARAGVNHRKAPGLNTGRRVTTEQSRNPPRMRVDSDAKRAETAGRIDKAVGKTDHGVTLQATLTTCNRRRASSERGP